MYNVLNIPITPELTILGNIGEIAVIVLQNISRMLSCPYPNTAIKDWLMLAECRTEALLVTNHR